MEINRLNYFRTIPRTYMDIGRGYVSYLLDILETFVAHTNIEISHKRRNKDSKIRIAMATMMEEHCIKKKATENLLFNSWNWIFFKNHGFDKQAVDEEDFPPHLLK